MTTECETIIQHNHLPLLPLREIVIFPHMMVPLFIGRERSIKALDAAMLGSKQILLVTQKFSNEEQPDPDSIYTIGTIANILQLLKLPDGTVKVLVEGMVRGKIIDFLPSDDYFLAEISTEHDSGGTAAEDEILLRSIKSQFDQYCRLQRKMPTEIIASVLMVDDPGRLTDLVAAHIAIKLEEKQDLLATLDVSARLRKLLVIMEKEIDLLQIEKKIRTRVKKQMEKTQREYYLSEQKKAIEQELGEIEPSHHDGDKYIARLEASNLPTEAYDKCLAEIMKLRNMPPMSAEATVSRNYLEWMLTLPWKYGKAAAIHLKKAANILDLEHYGLDEVKERILEYLAVQKRVKKFKGSILCLVGPPGVGKTSLARSIAHATDRKFLRMPLGGVRDEAEIRGHRRTYIGAMPGKIIQKIAKTGELRPLLLLDEIDKLGMDYRGDPASALLEVLDPEQNHAFNDHYLEVDYDLSEVMFVATANTLDIPAALRDRLEVIRIPGYTEDEKFNIAVRHLIPKQEEANGVRPIESHIHNQAIRHIIRYYTREAGVRNLEREIAKILRKLVKNLLTKRKVSIPISIDTQNLATYLGPQKFPYDLATKDAAIGQVKGLAWTEVGGEMLQIEAVTMPGKGKLIYTGQLGEVMQESIQAALTVMRTRAPLLGVASNFFEKHDVHVHVPEGATPKDGPSAGISMCTALASVILHLPVRADIAMTGEITLRGEVLVVGGIKEKLLAAHRVGIKNVIIPNDNIKDLQKIPDNIKKDLIIQPVRSIDEVLTTAIIGYTELAHNSANNNTKSNHNSSAATLQSIS